MKTVSIDDITEFFESFTRADLERLGDFYADNAYFKDPFNEVRGMAAIRHIYQHMFDTLVDPRFVILRRMSQDNECWLEWEFRFSFRSLRKGPEVVHGATHLVLAADGRIASHRDYWDAAEEVYEKVPVLGALMRWLKRKGAAA